MQRFEIIQKLINENQFKTYLEIGTQSSESAHQIKIDYKTGVDPKPIKRQSGDFNEFHNVTSNDFFSKNTKKFDLIFIDGDHSYQQVKMDFQNAMKSISRNGIIVLHDSLPHSKEYSSLLWNGEVFKLINDIHNSGASYSIVDSDHGVAIVKSWGELKDSTSLTYEQYVELKKKWNIITPDQFKGVKVATKVIEPEIVNEVIEETKTEETPTEKRTYKKRK
jgi:hypothetical protein